MILKPKLIHRYVIHEFFPPFALGLAICTFILLINHIFYMIDLFMNRGVDALTILKLVSLVIPMILPMSIPLAILLSSLLSYGRMAEDGEITAFRSSGLPHLQYTIPPILLAFICVALLIFF